MKPFAIILGLLLIVGALFGCSRDGGQAALKQRDAADLWHDTFDVSLALETYYQKERKLPTSYEAIRPYLSEELADTVRNENWRIAWRELPQGKPKLSDPEGKFIRVEVSITTDKLNVSENYELLESPEKS